MGYKLVAEVMDNAPKMALAEWKAMVILAEDANDESRKTWSPTTSEKIMRRLDLTPHAWANLRGGLVRKGLLEVVETGRRGHSAKYWFPVWPQFHPQAEDETEEFRPLREDETAVSAATNHAMGPQVEDETGSIGPLAEDANPEYVLQEVTPTHHYNSSEQRTHQTSLAAAAAHEAPPAAAGPSEREAEREKVGDQPQGQQRQLDAEDVSRAYAAARVEIGMPAAGSERVLIRAAAVELIREGQSAEYLVRLADWMGRERPGWIDLARARTAPGAPGLIPGQRNSTGHETYRDPNASAYRQPKPHIGFQNSTDPDAFEGTF